MSYVIQAESHQIQIYKSLMYLIQERAKDEGLSPSEFLSKVLTSWNYKSKGDPWGPMPPEVEARFMREMKQFYEEEKQGLHPKSYTLAQEMIDDMEA